MAGAMIGLGSRVRDRFSGMEAVVIARAVSLYEAPSLQLVVKQLDSEGRAVAAMWLPEARCEVLEARETPAWGLVA